jgi:hypothetical protein
MTQAKPNWRLGFQRRRILRFAAAFAPGKWSKQGLTRLPRSETARDSRRDSQALPACIDPCPDLTIATISFGAAQCGGGHW